MCIICTCLRLFINTFSGVRTSVDPRHMNEPEREPRQTPSPWDTEEEAPRHMEEPEPEPRWALTACCHMTIIRPLAARRPQKTPGRARRIRYWLKVRIIRVLQISPMILMSFTLQTPNNLTKLKLLHGLNVWVCVSVAILIQTSSEPVLTLIAS